MSLGRLLARIGEPVLIQQPLLGAPDEYGNRRPTWDAGSSVQARLEQTATSEDLDNRDTSVSTWRVFLPAGTELTAASRIVRGDGTVFQVTGPPVVEQHGRPTDHVEAQLRAVS